MPPTVGEKTRWLKSGFDPLTMSINGSCGQCTPNRKLSGSATFQPLRATIWPGMVELFDYPVSVVEADTAVIFCLDADLRITYCNPAWDRFALENGGEHLCRPAPIGISVLDYISGPDKQYFAKQYRRVIGQKEPWERDYECSSARVYRSFRRRVVPMQKRPGLFVVNLTSAWPSAASAGPQGALHFWIHGAIHRGQSRSR